MSGTDDEVVGVLKGGATGGKISSVSVAAVGGLALVVMSVAGCVTAGLVGWLVTPAALLAVLLLPAPALLGAALGGWALGAIGRSRGRLGGRTMALAALFVGLSVGALQGAIAGSALATWWPVKKLVVPVVNEMAVALEKGDYGRARRSLAPAASQVVSDERLAALLVDSRMAYGPLREATFGLDVFVDSYRFVRRSAGGQGGGGGGGISAPPKPVGLTFARGRVIAYVFVDQGALDNGEVLILDMLVAGPLGSGRTLLPAGQAAEAARSLGIGVKEGTLAP